MRHTWKKKSIFYSLHVFLTPSEIEREEINQYPTNDRLFPGFASFFLLKQIFFVVEISILLPNKKNVSLSLQIKAATNMNNKGLAGENHHNYSGRREEKSQ